MIENKTVSNILTKDTVNLTLEQLSDTFTLDEFIDHLIFTEKVNKGLDDSNNNRVFSTKEVENKLEKWLK